MNSAIDRRAFLLGASVLLCCAPARAQPSPKVGVLMLHGKSPGHAQDPHFGALKSPLQREGWEVLLPDMPWSRTRYLDGHWDQAMSEIAGHVKALQDGGAQKIVLVGHSMGVPAALSHAARGGVVDALVLLAPGHVPRGYYGNPNASAVRQSVDEARVRLAAGRGDETERYMDINQGRQQAVVTTAKNYLSYFDPQSDADMGVTAPRVPAGVPVLTVIGEKDPLFARVRGYFVDRLPANPKSKHLEIAGGHLDTPRLASQQIVEWIKASL